MSSSWRDSILGEFTPQVARLTLAADPDGLLLDEVIIQGIRERGFDLIGFDDHVAFRFAYESQYRSAWDRGEATDLVVVLRSPLSDLTSLPFDLLQAGRRLAFSLGELFPALCTSVVAALDPADLDKLWAAQARFSPSMLGANATKDFVLRHVFEVAPELIANPAQLLRVLLHRHYRAVLIPRQFEDRLVAVLRQGGRFPDWPLERIVPDRSAFFRFLQERWPLFVDLVTDEGSRIGEPQRGFGFEFCGPAVLPFDHDDVRVYVDNLFAEGHLQPIRHPGAARLSGHWASAGVAVEPSKDLSRRLDTLLSAAGESLPGPDARHSDWLAFAQRWAQLRLLEHEAPLDLVAARARGLEELASAVQASFSDWVTRRFAGLHSQPARPPVMVHHIARALALDRQEQGGRVALVVVDGLALDQWFALRSHLISGDPGWSFSHNGVFAWLPTLTGVSRQAIFAGRPPIYFPDSVLTTDQEPRVWTQFWVDHGLKASDVAYAKRLGESQSLAQVQAAIDQGTVKALGLVVDTVDRIMHGMELGSRGMHNQIRQWAEEGFLARLFELLLDAGFRVHLTADHGNVEAVGCGTPGEGSLADLRGQRARIYPSVELRDRFASAFPGTMSWSGVGLPEGCHVLFAPSGKAFAPTGSRVVVHGGASLEELIVPFVRVERTSA